MSSGKTPFLKVSITLPDGTVAIDNLSVPEKTFSSGKEGYYAQINGLVVDGIKMGGQIQIWPKSKQ